MRRSIIVGPATKGLLLALFVATASIALARESNDILGLPAPSEFNESENVAIIKELEEFSRVPVSIRDAIALAEKRMPGTRIVDVSFYGRENILVYKMKAYRGNQTWNGTIDASTGKVTGDESLTPVSDLDVKIKLEFDGFVNDGIYLSDAVEIAQWSTAGKAVSAGLGEIDGKLVFLVVVVADGSLKEVSVAASRKNIK